MTSAERKREVVIQKFGDNPDPFFQTLAEEKYAVVTGRKNPHIVFMRATELRGISQRIQGAACLWF